MSMTDDRWSGDEKSASRRAEEMVAYPKTMDFLKRRWNATPEEVAAWVDQGSDGGGLSAYVVNTMSGEVTRARFFPHPDDHDYVRLLHGLHWKRKELASFRPLERFLTGTALKSRWSRLESLDAGALIQAKIEEGTLVDYHPITGVSGDHWKGTDLLGDGLPSLEQALFSLAQIETIEANDFPAAERQLVEVEDQELTVSENAKRAAEALYEREGSRRWLNERFLEKWKSYKLEQFQKDGTTPSKNAFAREHCKEFHMAFSTARDALRNR